MEMPEKPAVPVFAKGSPKWLAVNQPHAEQWAAQNLQRQAGQLADVCAACGGYNVQRVLDGFGVIGNRTFCGLLRNAGFAIGRATDRTRRAVIVGYELED